eukprot:CAMPEP_0183526344 /NCGR_PEP_ID=MMETSP0371-20130417/21269_1 /TAXON_ID=268820 /ORGANISM="Peridinium aciculiferum, Strain PAER-2" /LENGTH=37 /DNA_ID= /DNA_START= /DNA_END= /DNA_ORIENTATION=
MTLAELAVSKLCPEQANWPAAANKPVRQGGMSRSSGS